MPPRQPSLPTRDGAPPGARDAMQPGVREGVPRGVNRIALALFRTLIARRRLRGNFRAVRLAFEDRLPSVAGDGRSLIFYLNHPSWWDPLLCMVLAPRLAPGRDVYAPIDAEQLRRYAVLRPLGLFPVEPGTRRGAVQFLRAAQAVLDAGDVLAITPQGAFTDVRVRPAGLKPGLGALLATVQRPAVVVPLALEYTFWNQRSPEALAAVGEPFEVVPSDDARSAVAWTELLSERLTRVQDELAALSQGRSADAFSTVLSGKGGAAGIYGRWQRLRGENDDH